jgi:hypothetical protein
MKLSIERAIMGGYIVEDEKRGHKWLSTDLDNAITLLKRIMTTDERHHTIDLKEKAK